MRFAFTNEQRELAAAVGDLLDDICSPADVRACWTNATGHEPARWGRLADMGVVGMAAPESLGGLGMDELDLVLVLEATGRAALPEPIVEHVAVVVPLLAGAATAELRDEWLPKLISGEAIASVQYQGKPHVVGGGYCDLVILAHGDALHAVPTADLSMTPQRSVDGARRLVEVDWHRTNDTVLVSGSAGFSAINHSFDRGALGTAAQLLGLADRMLAMTVAYAKEREQFGAPIGSFQAVKHHLADALVALELARPVVYRAAHSMAHDLQQRSRDVSMAKVFAGDAAHVVGRAALQCHGAIAYTTEYDLHLYLKRAWALASAWGDTAWHRERVALAVAGPRDAGAGRAEQTDRPLGETLG